MNTTIDIADLIQINKLLYNYINKLIAEKAELYYSVLDVLIIRANVLDAQKTDLNEMIKEIEWQNYTNTRPLLNEWKRSIINQAEDPETLEFEYWVTAALEAYKTALNSTSLINPEWRYLLMDQKCFVQSFLLELIRHRELSAILEQQALLA